MNDDNQNINDEQQDDSASGVVPAVPVMNPQNQNNAQQPGQSAQDGEAPLQDPAQNDQQMQDHTGAEDVEQQQPQVVSAPGSPEAGPAVVEQSEGAPQDVEYGYEKIKEIEKGGEQLSSGEKKESESGPQQPAQKQPRKKPEPQTEPSQQAQLKPPKIFGYHLSKRFTSNLHNIKNLKGKGDPAQAQTWIYMLLDRLLKKQTYNED